MTRSPYTAPDRGRVRGDDEPRPDPHRPQPPDVAAPRRRLRHLARDARARPGHGGVGGGHALGGGPSPAKPEGTSAVRVLGMLDDPDRRGRGHDTDRDRAVRRLYRVPQPGVARQDGRHPRRGERRPRGAGAGQRRARPRRLLARVRVPGGAARGPVRGVGRGHRPHAARTGRHIRGNARPDRWRGDRSARPAPQRHAGVGRRAGRADSGGGGALGDAPMSTRRSLPRAT